MLILQLIISSQVLLTNMFLYGFFLNLRVVLIQTGETGQDHRSFTLYTGIT
jgi:hypothetical protein